jgi:two-component system sensor histidine kinase TctE
VRLDEGTHGSGLGLAIVRDIANLHGAELVLSSAQGGGAVFTVTFP